MECARILAYITGAVDRELLLRNEYLATKNRILRAQIKGRLLLSDTEKKTLADIGYRLGRKALETVANLPRAGNATNQRFPWRAQLRACSEARWICSSVGRTPV